jgi:hypothetical protein
MVSESGWRTVKSDGVPCGAPRMHDSEFCFWHSPEHADEAVEARRLGGLRKRREHAIQGAYAYEGLTTVADIRRVLEVATIDLLGLDNTVARNRALISGAQAAARLLEAGEFEERLEALEAAIKPREQVTGRRRGEDPALPRMRDLIDGATKRLAEMRGESERYTGPLAVGEPDAELVDKVRALVEDRRP